MQNEAQTEPPEQAAQELAKAKQELSDFKKSLESRQNSKTLTTTAPTGWTPELVGKLSFGIGMFGIVLLALVAFLIWKNKRAEQILRTFGILVIIFAAVFLVIAGYAPDQITPVIGLLGTIAGYLLGRRIEDKDAKHDTER